MTDRELPGDEAQRALSEAMRRTRATVPVATGAGTDVNAELLGALRFILAFYEPGQRHLDTEAWKRAEASARRAVANAESVPVPLPDAAPSPAHTADGREIVQTIRVPAHTIQVVRAVPRPYISDDDDAPDPPGASSASPAAKEPTNG